MVIQNSTFMKRLLLLLFFSLFISAGLFAQNQSYQIKKNETLDDIAKKFRVDKEVLLLLNPDLNRGKIENLVIVIPARETDEKTPTASKIQFKEYRVKKKETLYGLAKENGISIDEIKKYNPYLNKEELGENDMIRIPLFKNEAKDFNASMTTSTFKNILHVVMVKETKYGISKKYEMTVAELDSLNPGIDTLQPGQVLRVINPIFKQMDAQKYEFYEVAPKETLYSLTRSLGISRDSLERINPILKELGLQAGMELKIPRELGSLADVKSAGSTLLNLSDNLSNFSVKKVAIMLPFNLNTLEDEEDPSEVLRKDPLMQISLDLYSGMKEAIDSVQTLGISVEAQVFDTQANAQTLENILQRNNFRNTSFILGPLLPNHLGKVAQYLKDEKPAIFSPLTSDEIKGSDKLFQTRPSSLIKEKLLVNYLDSLATGKNLIVLAGKNHQSFYNELKEKFPGLKRVHQEKEEYLQRSDLTGLMEEGRPNWVILATDDYADISNAVSSLNAERHTYDIRLFTAHKNSVYDEEVPSEFLSNLAFTYASIDKTDAANEHTTFVQTYLKKYGITPNSYAVRGFDITFDALLRSATGRDIFESVEDQKGYTEYVENRFSYQKKLKDGYYNSAVYLLKFEDDLELLILN